MVAEIVGAGGRAVAVAADVADRDQAQHLVDTTLAELGGLHILVNNAGITRNALIYAMTESDCWDVMRVNFGGVFNCTQAVLAHLMAQGDGAIVNVSSVMGERGWTGEANYSASKGAVDAFTRCAAVEGARFGVRVNTVRPGFAETDMVAELATGATGKAIKRQIPMRRFGNAAQIAAAVRFLAGPESSYLTGAFINVDGGASTVLGVGRAA